MTDPTAEYLVERAIRMALEHAALIRAVRDHTEDHPNDCGCGLCAALAVAERRKAKT